MNKVTPIEVRDALVNCFYEAHCADTELGADKKSSETYCLSIVKKAFKDQGFDFDSPTKESIIKVVETLVNFSKSFRSQEVIAKHQQEIMDLVARL